MTNKNSKQTTLGIENLLSGKSRISAKERIGLICNQSSVNHKFAHAADLLFGNPKFELAALFGPQHGIRGDVQDNMVESPHTTDKKRGCRFFALLGDARAD